MGISLYTARQYTCKTEMTHQIEGSKRGDDKKGMLFTEPQPKHNSNNKTKHQIPKRVAPRPKSTIIAIARDVSNDT